MGPCLLSPLSPDLRRAPVQQRSADRLARILDSCAGLLDETGYEQLTTRAVAERAEVPIGSVYRFFSNKRALVDALALRNLDAYADRIAARLAACRRRLARRHRRGARRVPGDEAERPRLRARRLRAAVPRRGCGGRRQPGELADRLAVLLAGHLRRQPTRGSPGRSW
ncbi:TetR family transcriptional regulator [Streptomyces badius]